MRPRLLRRVDAENGVWVPFPLLGRVPPEPVNKKRNPLFDSYRRPVTQLRSSFGDIRASQRHIARLRWEVFDHRFSAQSRLQQLDEPAEFYSIRFAKIENLVPELSLCASDDPFQNVVNIRVITCRRAIAKNGY